MEQSNRNTWNISAHPHTHKHAKCRHTRIATLTVYLQSFKTFPVFKQHISQSGLALPLCVCQWWREPVTLATAAKVQLSFLPGHWHSLVALPVSLSPVVSHDGVHYFPVCSSSHWSPTMHQSYFLFWACMWTCVYRLKLWTSHCLSVFVISMHQLK